MNPVSLLEKYFAEDRNAFQTVYEHSRAVADKALSIAKSLHHADLDLAFIEEAALLHDIGVCLINSPDLHCFGKHPYVCHGILGREILDKEGFPRHALVCERHIGVGLTVDDIAAQNLPLPSREMSPVTDEEHIITLADLFFSKRKGELTREKSVGEVRRALNKFGAHKVEIFDRWITQFRLQPAL